MRAALALLLTLAGGLTFPQNPSAPTSQPGAISGVVIDSTTQRPVAGAIVQIAGAPAAAPAPGVFVAVGSPRPQMTADRGRFVFEDLPAGASYTVTATKYGFLDGAYGRRGPAGAGNQPRRITLASGQWLRDLRVEVIKPGTIAGTIRNENGEPLVGVIVRAL